jgi:hypothetical protein
MPVKKSKKMAVAGFRAVKKVRKIFSLEINKQEAFKIL